MQRTDTGAVVALTLAFLLAGCGPPAVDVEHVLPGALPIPGDIVLIRAGDFTVRAGPKDGFAAFTRKALDEHLMDVPVGRGSGGRSSEITDGQIARVSGSIDVETKDVRGKRLGRRQAGGTGELKAIELATLVRTAAARVEFHVRRASTNESLGTVEIRRSYRSAADPAVRGELGLERPDDPARIPPTDKIVQHLLRECVEAFGRMVSPVVIEARVPLRPAEGRYAQLGLDAAREANHYEAIKQLAAAVRAAPNDAAAHFDLAAVAESAGKLDLAGEHYRKAWELSGEKDAEAEQGAARVRRVLSARGRPKG